MQSPLTKTRRGLHVALIPDGNGRWATARGRPRSAGHRAGARTVRRIVRAAPGLGIGTLTIFGFSRLNWRRPAAEVRGVFDVLTRLLRAAVVPCRAAGVRVELIGCRSRLPPDLVAAAERVERTTRPGTRLRVRIAMDYSARDEILRAMPPSNAPRTVADLSARLGGPTGPAPDVDLLIRTGGERRLSDFLLWECAHAELFFEPVAWPDFTPAHLAAALEDFAARERRFGALSARPPPSRTQIHAPTPARLTSSAELTAQARAPVPPQPTATVPLHRSSR